MTQPDLIATASRDMNRIEAILIEQERKRRLEPGTEPMSTDELRALKAELARLKSQVASSPSRAVRAPAEPGSLRGDFEMRIRERPLMAIGIAAAIGVLWGMRV